MEKIALSDVIVNLRRELLEAQKKGADAELKFSVDDIELELQFSTTEDVNAKGGVKFWVYNAEVGAKLGDSVTQKLKLKLKPLLSNDERRNFEIADVDEL